jgi:hypothetical protein
MTNEEIIAKLAQSAYLAVTGNYNDVTGTELAEFLDKTIDWCNQLTAEIELEADWNYLRTNAYDFGTVTAAAQQTIELPDEVRKIITSPYRDLVLSSDGAIISRFKTVKPSQIADPRNPETKSRVTTVNRTLVFSRPFTAEEVGATIQSDVVAPMPQLSLVDTELIDIVTPYQLLILGIGKNISLPDLVRGGTSPSFVQKYNDLLKKAVMENDATAEADDADRENLSFISGVW